MKPIRALIALSLIPLSMLLASKVQTLIAQDRLIMDKLEMKRFKSENGKKVVTFDHVILEDLQDLGVISGSYKANKYLTVNDTVYLKLRNPSVSKGDIFSIFNDGMPIPGVKLPKNVTKAHIKGFVQVIDVENGVVRAKIFNPTTDISIGDRVGPNMKLQVNLEPRRPTAALSGKVISPAGVNSLISAFEFVFLDKGENDQVQLNDRYFVFRTADGKKELTPGLPRVDIAELVVVHTTPRFSMAYVNGSTDGFEAGYHFRSEAEALKYIDEVAAPLAAEPR